MSHIRTYDNPKGSWLRAGQFPALTITGTLADYEPGEAYEGRLQINNALGDCSVLLTSGTLPDGATVTVDQATDEVVVTWPAYAVIVDASTSIANPGFESGDNGDWIKGAGFAIGEFSWEYDGDDNDEQHYDGTKVAEYQAGARGNSRLLSAHRRLCSPGTSVTASCQVQQGPSDANNTGGWVLLLFLDAGGVVLSEHAGNHVDSGSDAEWHQSSVTATAPTGTVSAVIGCECYRKKESKPMWVDHFVWNLAPGVSESIGTNGEDPIPLCVQVTDSAGRTASWCGTIERAPVGLTETLIWQAGIVAAGSSVTPTEFNWADDLIGAIQAASYGSKIIYMLPFIGSTIIAARMPLRDTYARGISTNVGVGFVDADCGNAVGLQNPTEKAALLDTLLPGNWNVANADHMGFGWWEGNFGPGTGTEPCGAYNAGNTTRYCLDLRNSLRACRFGDPTNARAQVGSSASSAHWYGQFTSGNITLFINGAVDVRNTTPSSVGGIDNQNIFAMGVNAPTDTYWKGRGKVFYITDGTMSDADVAAFHTLLGTFLITPTGR